MHILETVYRDLFNKFITHCEHTVRVVDPPPVALPSAAEHVLTTRTLSINVPRHTGINTALVPILKSRAAILGPRILCVVSHQDHSAYDQAYQGNGVDVMSNLIGIDINAYDIVAFCGVIPTNLRELITNYNLVVIITGYIDVNPR